MPTVLITGATGGLGLATAKAVRARGHDVILAGRREATVKATAEEIGAAPLVLDLSRPASVRDAVQRLPHVDAVACVAGLQLIRGQTTTADGIEETFAVNHLSHLALVDALLNRSPQPGRVVFIGSATHDPAQHTGTPAPLDDPVASLARPGPDTAPARTAGMRRYVTTRQLAIATSSALARQWPAVHISAFDPGLMPGTGLARQYPATVRFIWSTLAKAIEALPFASSPAASGQALAALLCDEEPPAPSGSYVDFRLRPIPRSRRAADQSYQDGILRDSRELLRSL